MIEINVETIQEGTVVRLAGEIDAASAATVQQKVLPLSMPDCRVILDMSKVSYMSSAGLRMLLSVYRQISGNKGKVVLVGLSDELKETMSMTGFLDYFTIADTLEVAFKAFG
ncbi:MAG: anti-sigma factor antagonist [Anaerolineales bacterium]